MTLFDDRPEFEKHLEQMARRATERIVAENTALKKRIEELVEGADDLRHLVLLFGMSCMYKFDDDLHPMDALKIATEVLDNDTGEKAEKLRKALSLLKKEEKE